MVTALLTLSHSAAHLDRTDAGVALARFAEHPAAADRLVGLVCDPEDTFVTRWTTDALVTRGDPTAWAVLARAAAGADDDTATWMASGIGSGLRMLDSTRRDAVATCAALATDADPGVRAGVAACLELLEEARKSTPLVEVPRPGRTGPQGSST